MFEGIVDQTTTLDTFNIGDKPHRNRAHVLAGVTLRYVTATIQRAVKSTRPGFLERGARPALGATERFSGGHEQRLSLGRLMKV